MAQLETPQPKSNFVTEFEPPPEAGVLRLVFQGFNPLEHKLIEGIVKLSQRRAPRLMILPVTRALDADVVVVDARDPAAKIWAENYAPLKRKPVIWVDGDRIPAGHTLVRRPVPWTILPMLLARALEHGPGSDPVSAPVAVRSETRYSAGTPTLTARPAYFSNRAGASAPTPAAAPVSNGPVETGLSTLAATPTISSTEGAGAPAPTPTDPPPTGVSSSTGSTASTGCHVLVVDDSIAMRAHSRTMLESLGFSVSEANSGEAALQEIMPGRFICVLMDVLMPGLSGYDTCKRIKDQSRTLGRVPVVMLTSRSSPFDRIRGKMAGCDGYLTKPVEAAALREALRRFVPQADDSPVRVDTPAGTMKPSLFPVTGKLPPHQAQGA